TLLTSLLPGCMVVSLVRPNQPQTYARIHGNTAARTRSACVERIISTIPGEIGDFRFAPDRDRSAASEDGREWDGPAVLLALTALARDFEARVAHRHVKAVERGSRQHDWNRYREEHAAYDWPG